MPQDILLDDSGDLACVDGDFVIGESTLQHQKLLLITQKGEWKENPKCGIGIENYLNDDDTNDMLNEINDQFEKDGMHVTSVNYINQQLQVDANYE
ncbi:MAG: oxidase [Bacteroidetes bacterium]|nr:oxidase [Bacteroidota bacterium]